MKKPSIQKWKDLKWLLYNRNKANFKDKPIWNKKIENWKYQYGSFFAPNDLDIYNKILFNMRK